MRSQQQSYRRPPFSAFMGAYFWDCLSSSSIYPTHGGALQDNHREAVGSGTGISTTVCWHCHCRSPDHRHSSGCIQGEAPTVQGQCGSLNLPRSYGEPHEGHSWGHSLFWWHTHCKEFRNRCLQLALAGPLPFPEWKKKNASLAFHKWNFWGSSWMLLASILLPPKCKLFLVHLCLVPRKSFSRSWEC